MRRPSRGLWLSVALHVAAAILLSLRYAPAPRTQPVVVTFELVQLTNGTAPETGRDPEAPEAEAAADNRVPGRDEAVADGSSVADDTGIDVVDSEELHAANTESAASARARTADLPAKEPATPREAAPQREAPPREARDAPRPEQEPQETQAQRPEPQQREPEEREPQEREAQEREAQEQAPQEPETQKPPSPQNPVPRQREEPAAESPIELASIIPDTARLAPPAVPERSPAPSPEQASNAARSAPPSEPSIAVSEAAKHELTAQIEEWAASEAATDVRPAELSSPSRHSTEWQHKGHRYFATFEELPAEDSMHLDRIMVSVSTEQNGQRLSTRLELKRLAFSSFAQFVDRWDPQVQIHDDRIDGRFHSNSEIVITKSRGVEPQFLGKVTTAEGVDTSYSQGHISRKNVFLGGLETRARRIALPRRFLPFDGEAPAERDRIQRFSRDARITFYADGSFGWRYWSPERKRGRESRPEGHEQRQRLPDGPYYLIAEESATLYVDGVVNGKVLVYSPRTIVIADDLVYADDPVTNEDSDDYVGLVSDGDVEIGVPELTGPGDLRLQASIYARHRFAVRDYLDNEDATLSLYGSLTAGSLTATEPRFRTKLEYDQRFEEARPPGFPLADRYEIAEWDGRWTLESEAAATAPPRSAPAAP